MCVLDGGTMMVNTFPLERNWTTEQPSNKRINTCNTRQGTRDFSMFWDRGKWISQVCLKLRTQCFIFSAPFFLYSNVFYVFARKGMESFINPPSNAN